MDLIKLAIVDSEEVFREGIVRLLKEQTKMEIVFQGGSSREAIEKCNSTKPDLMLIDSHVTNRDALQVMKEIQECSPGAKLVILSRLDSGKNPAEFLKAGARAVLARNISASDLVKSLDLITSGRIIISPHFAEEFLKGLSSKEDQAGAKEDDSLSILSDRELEIAVLIAEGDTNREIAGKLFITENTVKVHVKNILNKLELKNRQQLAVYAVMKEWINNNPDVGKKEIGNTM